MRLPAILLIFSILTHNSFSQCDFQAISKLKKTALVIGMSKYINGGELANPKNDAFDISNSLKTLGFDVQTFYDIDKKTMDDVIDDWFSTKVQNCDVGLLYYAGHGIENNGVNYLIPVDAKLTVPVSLKYEAYSMNRILDNFAYFKTKVAIILLDACRDDPFTRSWNKNRSFSRSFDNTNNIPDHVGGLASVTATGTFIGFAASPGRVAGDGNGRNGIYTSCILNNLLTPNMSVLDIFTKVTSDVKAKTNNQQVPFLSSSLDMTFCFSATNQIGNRNITSSAEDVQLASTANSLLHKVEFNSSISDVIKFEFNNDSQIDYDKLPVAIECAGQNIRYYWRYLNQSSLGVEINKFFDHYGLRGKVTGDSYIVYYFRNNKLIKIALRLFSSSNDFNTLFNSALRDAPTVYPNKYQTKVGSTYFITGTSYQDVNSTELVICNEEGYNACIHDWWNILK